MVGSTKKEKKKGDVNKYNEEINPLNFKAMAEPGIFDFMRRGWGAIFPLEQGLCRMNVMEKLNGHIGNTKCRVYSRALSKGM